jgi:protein SEY1
MDQFGKASSVPTVMVILIILLGWNEFMYIISNPLALILLVTVASAAYAIHAMGLAPVILPVVMAAYNQIHTMVANVVNQYVNPQPQGGAAVAQAEAGRKIRTKKD